MHYVHLIIGSIWEHIKSHSEIILKALLAVFYFLAGIHIYIYAVLALAFIDVVTGIAASLKKGEKFTSRTLRKGLLEKTVLYMLLLVTVFVLDMITKTVFHHEAFYFSFVITFLICSYEIASIMENVQVLRPNLPFVSALVRIFGKLHKKTIQKLEKNVDDIADKVTDFETMTDPETNKKNNETTADEV